MHRMQKNNIYGRAVSGRSGTLAPGSELKASFVVGRGKGGKGGSFSEIQTKKDFCAEKSLDFLSHPCPSREFAKSTFGQARSRWLAVDYFVRTPVVDEIISFFGVKPELDAFASFSNRRCEKWWGPGSPHGEDAFSQSWSNQVLWLNPPFDLLGRVLEKIIADRAHGILVLPDWPRRRYLPKAQDLCMHFIQYPRGFKFFEREGWRRARGLKWPVSVMFVCGHLPRCTFSNKDT